MEAVTLARPYARAAFQVACDAEAMEAWSAHLASAAALAADPRMAGLVNNPELEPGELARLYRPQDVADGSPFARFLGVMADSRRLPLLPEVAQHFDDMRHQAEHAVTVHLTCAVEPPQVQVDKLVEVLRQRLDRRIDIDIEVDAAILGGAIVNVDGEVIDGSVRARLERLQNALKH